MKRCRGCKQEKPIEEFSPRASRCKPCRAVEERRRYSEASEDFQARIYAARKARYEQHITALKARPCADCGGEFPTYVMDFDHLGDKEFGISSSRYKVGLARLLAEVAKCDVVCANCHRIRTHERGQNRVGVA